jgi:hypothetical protein
MKICSWIGVNTYRNLDLILDNVGSHISYEPINQLRGVDRSTSLLHSCVTATGT